MPYRSDYDKRRTEAEWPPARQVIQSQDTGRNSQRSNTHPNPDQDVARGMRLPRGDLGALAGVAMIWLATLSSPEATATKCIVISNVRARDIVFRMCASI